MNVTMLRFSRSTLTKFANSNLGSSRRVFSSTDRKTPEEEIQSLPWQFLRAACKRNYDYTTHQRIDVPFDVKNGKPSLEQKSQKADYEIEGVSIKDGAYVVEWNDGLSSNYPIDFIHNQLHRFRGSISEDRNLWSNMTEEKVRNSSDLSIQFSELITEKGMKEAIRSLYRYGIFLITETPVNDNGSAIAAIGAAVGGGSVKEVESNSVLKHYQEGGSEIMLPHATDGPLRTLYGTVWSTKSGSQADGASVADSAYGNDGLPLHTDMTYYINPPGLQIFTMIEPAQIGGESIFADGFALSNHLRDVDPNAFDILSNTIRRFRCVDSGTGWHLEASGPVIQVRENTIVGIRHNDLDRLPDLPAASSEQDINIFYKGLEDAHASWDSLIAQDRFRLVMKLQPGDTMIVANQVSFLSWCKSAMVTAVCAV
jgi:hypothetical protein